MRFYLNALPFSKPRAVEIAFDAPSQRGAVKNTLHNGPFPANFAPQKNTLYLTGFIPIAGHPPPSRPSQQLNPYEKEKKALPAVCILPALYS
ncbi:MAG: hypothetical protein H6559_33205 [Lewinellaceae bacterium]|nr:hypothetical protein [Lewinellaceae bacterium]